MKNRKLFNKEILKETPPCVFGGPIYDYFNSAEVKKALNIPSDLTQEWELCSDQTGFFQYRKLQIGSYWIWESLKGKYRMLKYSGDTDGAVPLTGTMRWIDALNRTILEPWRPYFTTNSTGTFLGGYIEEYDGLTLGTVHGAGHMAP